MPVQRVKHDDSNLPTSSDLPSLADLVAPSTEDDESPRVSDGDADAPADADHSGRDDASRWSDHHLDWQGPVIQLVDGAAVEDALESRVAQQTSFEDLRRSRAIVSALRARGEFRRLVTIPENWAQLLCDLLIEFPHFREVIQFVRSMVAIACCGDRVLRITPMLLAGPPGIGKTRFAERFAQMLGTEYAYHRMETAQCNAALSGSADYWSNSKPGLVFELLVHEDVANPVLVLDEIDKAQAGQHDPLSSLLSLFERDTAKSFCDLSYPWITLDASHIIWICTCNDLYALPAPVLSRLKTFEIPAPCPNQALRIVDHIFSDLRAELPTATKGLRIAPMTKRLLARLPPRRAKQVLLEGIGHVLLRGGKQILPSDIELPADAAVQARRQIGFV